jgi:hypothetical protein
MATRPKHELQVLAKQFGWKVRPLTLAEINGAMTSDEMAWHEVFNAANFTKAFEPPPAPVLPTADELFVQQEKDLLADQEYLQYARDHKLLVSREGHQFYKDMMAQIEAGKAAVQTFLDQHDEFIVSDSNQKAVRDYLAQYKLPVTLENLEIAFEALTHSGEIAIDKTKVDPPVQRWRNKIVPMDEYYASTAGDRAIHSHVVGQNNPASRTDASPRGKFYATVLTEGDSKERGKPIQLPMSQMTASQYQYALNNDPSFRAAVEGKK